MAVSGHHDIYGGDEGLRHHLCVSHGEHLDEGASREHMEDLHEDEHPYGNGAHRGEWGCPEHDPSDEPTEFHDMHESGGIGEIHRGIGVSLPDRVHRVVHDESRPAHERAQALLGHVSDHPGHLGMHWTTENRVAEDFAERSARHEANEDQRGRYALNDFTWGHEKAYKDTPLGKPGTAVVFHAHEPSLDAIESDGHRLSNGGAYGWSEHGEREVPIRDTHSLDLKGISWAPMHSDDEVPGHGEYTHHEFGQEHTAALLGHFEAADDTSYRMNHQGPDADDGEAMHEVGSGKVYPADIHQHPEWYIGSEETGAWDSYEKVRKSKDWPSRRVTMYRSLPSPHREVNTGDWVTSSAAYAREHGRQSNSDDDWPVVKFEARADQLRTSGDSINEWSYHGPKVNRALVHFSGGKNHRGKGPRGGKADAALHEHEPPEMNAAYNAQSAERRRRIREEREARESGQREAAVHHSASGETAPEGHQVWAVPAEGRSPAAEEVHRNMMTREPGDEHGSAWYQGISYHGPYHVIRHPQTRQVWVVDRHGRDASPTGGHYGNPERDGNWGEHQAWQHQYGLESAGPEAHRFGTPGEPRFNLMDERTPAFPHSRVDPEDEERVRRPEPRVHAPEGHSPEDEYHGSYEVVRHPETGKFHVVDNAGRNGPGGYLSRQGFPDQLHAERSRDYIEKRQQSKERARGIADSIFSGGMDILDPGGTPESRQSDENIRTSNELMTRYHGGKGQFKFDSDEEGGSPYYEREHHHENGQGSGWYVKHHGGPRADVYHRATGDEAHDTMWMGEDEHGNLPDTYGEHDLAADLREWHERPDGMRRHLETERPEYGGNARVQQWKKQHLGAVQFEVVAHFEDPPEPPPFAGAGQEGGERRSVTAAAEYGPKPEWQRGPEGASDEEQSANFDRQNKVKHDWEAHVTHGISTGQLTPERAKELGHYFDGHQTDERGDPKWKPLPQHLYHVTTDLPGVREHGLKSRRELDQLRGGHGLGGGPDDMISLTDDHDVAKNILRAVHEFHHVVNGRYTPAQMWEDAKAGNGASRPFHEDVAQYHLSGWKDGDPLPEGLTHALNGTEAVRHEGWGPPTGEVRRLDPDRRREQSASFYKNFAAYRSWAGGHEDPLFFSTDTKAFAAKDPKDFGIVHARPRPGAMGHPVSALGEWRTGTGDALETHRAERLEGSHLKEASLRAFAALENPHTHGHDWYHGSPHAFGEFGEGSNSPLEYEGDPEDTSHWNTLVGNHFAASHRMAEEFSKGEHGNSDGHGEEGPAENVVHARLEMKNPKVYASEHDMDQEAYEHEWKAGNHHDVHHDPGEHAEAKEEGWEDELPRTYQYAGHGDRMRPQSEADPEYARMGHYHPYATGWLNSHPDKFDIAQRFRQRLQAAGHDGIVYGNEFEKHHGTDDQHHVCAIPFHAGQIDVTQRHSGSDCMDQHSAVRQWPGRSQPMLPGMGEHEGSLEVVAHFEEPKTAAGPFMQQKLFHMQPDPTLNAPESGRRNPADPEGHLHWRKEHDEDYQPDECPNCGGDRKFRERHAEEHDDWLHEQDWHTDWDAEGPAPGEPMHRGMATMLPQALHDRVHDASVPVARRARELAQHVIGGGGLGNFWSSDPDVSKSYAESTQHGLRHRYPKPNGEAHHQTPVMIHAKFPGMEHVVTDPEQLEYWGVHSYHKATNREIPIQHQAPLHVTGISWGDPGHGGRRTYDGPEHAAGSEHLADDPHWTHHEFGGAGIQANASAAVVAHFEDDDDDEDPDDYSANDEWDEDAPPERDDDEPAEEPVAHRNYRLPYMTRPPEGELIDHLHHHHGLDARTSDLYMNVKQRERWHGQEHQYKTNSTHQHDHPQGAPGEEHWPDVFELSEHTDFPGGTRGDWSRVPGHTAPFRPLRSTESVSLPEVTAVHPDDDDEEESWEEPEPDLEPAGHERDEHDFIHPMVRDRESGERYPDPNEEPRCLNCERARGHEVRHRPEDGHPVPGVQEAIDRRESHERDLDEGRYDRTRYCDANCQRSHEEDREHGVSVHHTFNEGEAEHDSPRILHGDMPQLSGPYDEPAGRQSGSYEVRSPSAEHRCHYCRNILPQYRKQGAVTAAYDWNTDEGPYTWDEIAQRHPRVYGDDEDHAPGSGEGGGYDIADAAAELYHDRPSHPYRESEGTLHPSNGSPEADIEFHPRTVDVNRIDYMRVDPGEHDRRVERAKRGFQDHRQREKIPPLILVHRHGVYQVADGSHRGNGAAQAHWPSVRAYVAYSPHEDEPFAGRDGEPPQRGPFHGAETRDRPPMPDANGGPARRISFPGFPHTTERPRPQAHEASRREPEVTLIPVYDTAPAIECSPLAQVVAAAGLLGAWAPQTREDALEGISAFSAEVLAALRQGLLRLAGVIEEMPVHPDVAELVHDMARAVRTASEDSAAMLRGLPPEAPWQESGPPNR